MKTPSMSSANEPILLAEMQVQFAVDGRSISAPAKITYRLWPNPCVVIEVSNIARDPQPLTQDPTDCSAENVLSFPLTSEGPSFVQLENGMWVEVVPEPWLFHQQEAELRLRKSPSVVLDQRKPIDHLEFDVLNVTRDLFNWPLTLQAAPWDVRIDPVPNLRELERALRTDGGYAVTHTGVIQDTHGKGISGDDVQHVLRGLDHFLSFVCGSQCAITNVVGFDDQGYEVWKRWGSYHASSWKPRRSWADIAIRGALTEVFEQFWVAYIESSEHLDRVLGWYAYSNEAGAIDLSIILNQTVLEILLSMMPSRAGQMGQRIADMLLELGVDPQIPTPCNGLTELAKQNSFQHGPHTLVEIRNSLIHSQSTLRIHSIDVYHEAKQLGLWYVELLLLRMFKYTGEYASRLTDVQRPGATELVPWDGSVKP